MSEPVSADFRPPDSHEKAKQSSHRIRSFSGRHGRVTAAQQHALDTLSGRYRFELDESFNAAATFGRTASLILEIGFGNGETLAEVAAANPQQDYLGVEVHRPGVGRLMQLLDQKGLTNVRIYQGDAVELLEQCIGDGTLDGVNLFFPDPWPKKRHHKRRLVTPPFIELIARKLNIGGRFHAATDWENYAEQIGWVLDQNSRLHNLAPSGHFIERPAERPLTKFEQRGIKLGHPVADLIYQRI